ncbi:hypothetical protein ACHAXT_000658 [Thalassiosira profunda]
MSDDNYKAINRRDNSRSNRPHHSMQTHQQSTSKFCHTSEPPIAPDTPLPPPLPKPNYSFRGRAMPSNLLAFNSKEGKERFGHALHTNHAEAYFPLSQQFINQSDPAYCGMTTLVLVLNALAMDPNVRWRGGWRWYGDEGMLLERCCLEEERVRREGVTMAQYCALARCQGAELALKHPENGGGNASHADHGKIFGVEEFRRDIIDAVQHPPHTHWDDVVEEEGAYVQNAPAEEQSKGGFFLVTSFARHALNQTGDGHFSPVAAYHPPTDSCLVLDVARFKYAPYWVSVEELYEAMKPPDKATGKSRGWILMYPPSNNARRDADPDTAKHWTKEEMEGKRPAATVPESGSGTSLCPVEAIKIDFCSAGQR